MDYAFEYWEKNKAESEEDYTYTGTDDSCSYNKKKGIVSLSGHKSVTDN